MENFSNTNVSAEGYFVGAVFIANSDFIPSGAASPASYHFDIVFIAGTKRQRYRSDSRPSSRRNSY